MLKKIKKRLNEYRREWSKKHKEETNIQKKNYSNSLRGRFNQAKHAAKRRNISFNISFEIFKQIASEPCFYCNNKLGNKIITGSGLDRLDNLIGYEVNNIKSCCWVCNKIKNDTLTVQETKAAVDAILEVRRNNIICD